MPRSKEWKMPINWVGKKDFDKDVAKLIKSRKQRAVIAQIHQWLSPRRGGTESKCGTVIEGTPWLYKSFRDLAKEATSFLQMNEATRRAKLSSSNEKWAMKLWSKVSAQFDGNDPEYFNSMVVDRNVVDRAINAARELGFLIMVDGNHNRDAMGGKYRNMCSYFTIDYQALDTLIAGGTWDKQSLGSNVPEISRSLANRNAQTPAIEPTAPHVVEEPAVPSIVEEPSVIEQTPSTPVPAIEEVQAQEVAEATPSSSAIDCKPSMDLLTPRMVIPVQLDGVKEVQALLAAAKAKYAVASEPKTNPSKTEAPAVEPIQAVAGTESDDIVLAPMDDFEEPGEPTCKTPNFEALASTPLTIDGLYDQIGKLDKVRDHEEIQRLRRLALEASA